MTDLPWYKFFPGDYGRDTADLSMLEDAAYRRLLDAYFCNRGLPSDLQRCQRIARASMPEEKAAVDFVVKRFFRADGERLVNGRAEREIEARDAYFAEQRRKAKLGGRPPKQAEDNPGVKPGDNPGVKPGDNPGVKPGRTRGVPHPDLDLDLDPDSEEEREEEQGGHRGGLVAAGASPPSRGASAAASSAGKGNGEDRTLPPGTMAALRLVPEDVRAWTETILITAHVGNRSLADTREALSKARIPDSTIEMLMDPMRGRPPS